MNRESFAWLIAGAAGVSSGMIAGFQDRVTAESVLAISAVLSLAVGLVARLLPRSADPI